MRNIIIIPAKKKVQIIVPFLALFLFFSAGIYSYYVFQSGKIRDSVARNIQAIAELKIDQITQWRKSRFADARIVIQFPLLANALKTWMHHPADTVLKRMLVQRMKTVKTEYGYHDIFLVSTTGNVLLTLDTARSKIGREEQSEIARAKNLSNVFEYDFFRSSIDHKIYYDVITPMQDSRNQTIAILVFRTNPEDFLYPLLRTWPIPSQSSETVLLRKEGDSILYLNNLRFRDNIALQLKFPLTRTDLPAVQVALGRTGIFDGYDYRGVHTLAYLAPIPNTPWLMVAKIDHSEVFGELAERAVILVIIAIILTALLGALAVLFFRSHETRLYDALLANEEKYKILFMHAHDALFIVDERGRILDVNPKGCTMLGYTHNELIGRPMNDLYYGIGPATQQNDADQAQTDEPLIEERLMIRKDGSHVPVEFSRTTMPDGKMQKIIRDITERKRAIELFRKKEEEYQNLLGKMDEGFCLIEFIDDEKGNPIDYRYLEVNPAFVKLTGLHDVVGRTLTELVPQIDKTWFQVLAEVARTGISIRKEGPSNNRDRYYNVFAYRIGGEGSRKVGTIFMDITESKRYEEELKESKVLLAETEKAGRIGGWSINPETMEQTWTEETFTILEIERSNGALNVPEGMSFIHPEYQTQATEAVNRAIQFGEPYDREWKIVTAKGNERWVHSIGNTYKENGKIVRVAGSFQDITERKKFEEELKEYKTLLADAERIGHIGGWTVDVATLEQRWTDEIFSILEYDKSLGAPNMPRGMEFIMPAYRDKAYEGLKRTMQAGEEFEQEWEVETAKGTHLWIQCHARAEWKDGQITRILGTIQDVTERKQAEEKFRARDVEYRNLVENMDESFAIFEMMTDEEGRRVDFRIVETNPAFRKLTKDADPRGKTVSEVFPVVTSEWHEKYEQVIRTGKALRIGGMSEGVQRYVTLFVYPIAGMKIGLLFLDITEQKHAEEMLRAKDREFRTLVESMDEGFLLIEFIDDAEGNPIDYRYLEVNSAFEKLTGLHKVVGHTLRETLPNYDHAWFQLFADVARTGISSRKEGPASSHERYYNVFAYRIGGEGSRKVGILFIDITESKRTEMALRKKEREYQDLVNSMEEGFCIVEMLYDDDGTPSDYRFLEVNPMFEKHMGLHDAVGKTIRGMVPEHDRHWFEYYGKVARTGESLHFEAPAKAMQRLYNVFAYRIGGEGSNRVGIIFTEITERKAMEDVVKDVQRREAIGVLSAGIAHDFNNLLAVMMGNISLAQTEIPAGARVAKYLSQTKTAIESAADLTRQMLAYSGKGKFLVEPVDLVAEIEKNVNLLTVSVPKNVRLEMNLPSRKVFVTGDRGQLKQILMNLVINGGDAIGEKQGRVVVSLTVAGFEKMDLAPFEKIPATDLKPGRYALLEVSDTGAGMSAETLARIFDPFFTTKFIGRGLGLSAVLGIIKGHEGGIVIESTEGVGSTFKVILPCSEEEEHLAEAPAPDISPKIEAEEEHASADDPAMTILVIDDESDVAEMACELLASAHYRAIAESNPLRGIELYREHKNEIGVILLDWSMPEMNGREAARALHEIDPEARIIITSGYSAEEIKVKLGTETVAGVLQKPYSMEALYAVVESVMV